MTTKEEETTARKEEEKEKRERITAILDNRFSVRYYDDTLHRLSMINSLLTYTWCFESKDPKYVYMFIKIIDKNEQEFPITEKLYQTLSGISMLCKQEEYLIIGLGFIATRIDLINLLIDIGCSASTYVWFTSTDATLIRKGYRYLGEPHRFPNNINWRVNQNYIHNYIITL